MYTNIYYDKLKSIIHLWVEKDNKRIHKRIKWAPYVFIKDDKGDTESIDGIKVSKKNFNTYSQYHKFCYEHKDNENVFEDYVTPEIQYLSEIYYKIPMEEIVLPKLKIYSIDIEVDGCDGMPKWQKATDPVVCITIHNFENKKSYTFGLKEYSGKNEYETEFHYCETEEKLFSLFIKWWRENFPDVITGWNISSDNKVNKFGGFDLPYIINRINNLFPDKNIYKLLSPINNVFFKQNNDRMHIDIAGISIIDYMSLYKWYSQKNLEKYSLERVAQEELDKGKLDYENEISLKELYKNNWNRYVDYNVVDTILIRELEEKLKYIKLAQYLTLLCKNPLNSYNTTTKLIEGLMLTRLRRKKKCAPKFKGGVQSDFDAAYVKEPIPKLYGWSYSIDIQSSYPFSIVALNISPEKLIGKIIGFSHDEIINFTMKKQFPEFKMIKNNEIVEINKENLKKFNNFVKNKTVSIAPNGSVFFNIGKGAYSEMEREIFIKRKEIKKQISYLKSKNKDNKYDDKIEELHTMQWSLKIIINSAYGACAVPYSRYFCQDVAEAIPAVGRASIMYGEKYINEILNDLPDELTNIIQEIKEKGK